MRIDEMLAKKLANKLAKKLDRDVTIHEPTDDTGPRLAVSSGRGFVDVIVQTDIIAVMYDNGDFETLKFDSSFDQLVAAIG